MPLILRDYQEDVVDKIARYIGKNPLKSPLADVPTGGGKSAISARLIQRMLGANKPVLYLTMTGKLVSQTHRHIFELDPALASDCSIACAKLGKNEYHGKAILGTIQTVYKNLDKLFGIAYIIVDEAHQIPRDPKSMYGKLFAALNVPIIHLSGSPWRTDSGLLHEGPGATANDLVARITMDTLRKDGWTVRYQYRRGPVEIDVSKVKVVRGEFSQREMEDIAMDMALCSAIARDIKAQFDAGRRSCIAFCVSIDHARMLADHIERTGLTAVAAASDDPEAADQGIEDYLAQRVQVLCNVGMATTGLDAPHCDFIAWCRATMSGGLLTQGTGRGSRPDWQDGVNPNLLTAQERIALIAAGPKPDCLVRDYGGNFDRHGVVEDIAKGVGSNVVKQKFRKVRDCPKCEEIVSRTAEKCPGCGEMLISHARALQQSQKASLDLDLGAWLDVEDFTVSVYARAGKRDALRIAYRTSDQKTYPLFIFFELDHHRAKMERRWFACGGQKPFPSSAGSAMNRAERGEIRKPFKVEIKREAGSGFVGVNNIDLKGTR